MSIKSKLKNIALKVVQPKTLAVLETAVAVLAFVQAVKKLRALKNEENE